MRKARKTAKSLLQHLGADAERKNSCRSTGRILRIVQSAQRADLSDAGDPRPRAAIDTNDGFAFETDAVRHRSLHRYAGDSAARLLDPIRDRCTEMIVHADNGRAAALDARHQSLLHRRVVLDGAVAIDMILGDVQQNADARIERWREIDLVRRHLDHMDSAFCRRLQ